ncbi:MAG: PKD domain-containing protein [Flammeovirgaceae bacterium]|nr:PKD domain-containing protein [Flammeovirgaceae bacterium]
MKFIRTAFLIFIFLIVYLNTKAQCTGADILEPGFAFLTSSRGCAPFTVQIQTLYLSSVPGTEYYVNWGDGTPEETYVQTNATGVTIQHTFPNSPVDCGYDIIIDAANACNPRGSVVPVQTQVVVWTNDVVAVDPGVFRVCQGYATTVQFTDNSDWNCYPRATRENNEARWIQWIYGTGLLGIQIPGIQVDGVTPGAYPYQNPAPFSNPFYPILAPGELSLPIQVPATTPADIGREFEITFKNWNQCNPYDNVLTDANAFNPVNGDLVNGDNAPQVTTARILIVDAPNPQYVTRAGNAGGAIQSVFCIGDDIFFDNLTPGIAGSIFQYTWEFYDNSTGAGAPISTSTISDPTFSYATSGVKLIRLRVMDANAAGNCEAIFESTITISPSLVAQIGVTDLSGNVITPDFCQNSSAPFSTFDVRFSDVSPGTITASTLWLWEFFDENNNLILRAPAAGFSSSQLGPFDRAFVNTGVHRARLTIRDNITGCQTVDEVQIRVFENPQPDFSFNRVCEGNATAFTDLSSLNSVAGSQIVLREWDFDYNGTFTADASYAAATNFNYTFATPGAHVVALRVTTDLGTCAEIKIDTVQVDPLPTASFTPNVTSGCSELDVTFTNNSVAGQPDVIDEFVWEINEGAGFYIDSIQRPTDPGFTNIFQRRFVNTNSTNKQVDVRLRVRTVNGCEQVTTPVTITIFPGPGSGFVTPGYSLLNPNCSPVNVTFTADASTQSFSPTDYRWTITDVNGVVTQVSTGTSPTFNYSLGNTIQSIKDYSVELRATLSTGCFGDSARTIRINPVPSSLFDIDTIEFDCNHMLLSMEATQKGLVEYLWTITVDGTPVFNQVDTDVITYDFNRVATGDQSVVIQLQTRNFATCQSVVSSQSVTVPQYQNINTSFTATPLTQTLPNSTVTIANTTNAGPWQYIWDFDDGTTSTQVNPGSHTYATYGTYVIQLTVTNNVCVEQHQVTVTINPIPPIVDFDYQPGVGCAPLTVAFTNLSQFADPSTYQWQFGINQGGSNAVNPTYTYTEPGFYSVTLTASNSTGQVVSYTHPVQIQVYDRPIAQFGILGSPVIALPGNLYVDNFSFGASGYQWDFGDGGTSSLYEPVHLYTTEGVFDISLVATNSDGCSDTLTLPAVVRTVNRGEILLPNAFSPSPDGPGSGGGIGSNDIFKPLYRGVSEYQLLIFNRWGELLFETRDLETGWDGYYKGKLCQQDVYVYKITAKMENGETITRVGDIHLMR